MKDDTVYLRHILDCLDQIEEDLTPDPTSFFKSRTIQNATLRNLQVLAESTTRLSDEIKASRPEIPWREIAAFRNILVHDYLGIDLEAVWDIVREDLPDLRAAVTRLIDQRRE